MGFLCRFIRLREYAFTWNSVVFVIGVYIFRWEYTGLGWSILYAPKSETIQKFCLILVYLFQPKLQSSKEKIVVTYLFDILI